MEKIRASALVKKILKTITIETLASRLGVAHRTISRWKAGDAAPEPRLLAELLCLERYGTTSREVDDIIEAFPSFVIAFKSLKRYTDKVRLQEHLEDVARMILKAHPSASGDYDIATLERAYVACQQNLEEDYNHDDE